MAALEKEKKSYVKHSKLSQTKTSVWSHFLKATDNLSAKCMSCNKILKTLGGSTSGLHTHLRTSHSIVLKDIVDAGTGTQESTITTAGASTSSRPLFTDNEVPKKRSKLTDFFSSTHSLPETVSRMSALDGTPFSFFVKSKDQRRIMAKAGYKLPNSSNTIKNMVIKHGETMKLELTNKLRKLKSDGVKLSLTLDEWTSLGNRRFLNVNVHSPMLTNNFANLGLVRVFGSMPARTCLQLLEKRLVEFDLCLKQDVISTTTDGASVMVAFGRDAALFHQQCFAHGIQLAVLDVLYRNQNFPQPQASPNETENDLDPCGSASESSDEEDDSDGFNVTTRPRANQNYELIFKELVAKVRKVVKLFRKSPTRNDNILQKYVKEEIGHELQLIMDCRTRWNSLADMLERFVRLKIPIQKSLIDLDKDLEISENEFKRLADLSSIFQILKATVELLCKRNANLMTADAALIFMLKKLESMHHDEPVARDLAVSLKRRIKERRLLAASTLHYLHNSKAYFDSANEYSDVFLKPNADEMRKYILAINKIGINPAEILESTSDAADDSVPTDDDILCTSNNEMDSLSVRKQLEMAVQQHLQAQDNSSKTLPEETETLIKIEMALYENGGTKGKFLESAYNGLKSIPPTSVEAERAFSASGYFCNHLRSKLSDKTLDTLSFLRSYYLNHSD